MVTSVAYLFWLGHVSLIVYQELGCTSSAHIIFAKSFSRQRHHVLRLDDIWLLLLLLMVRNCILLQLLGIDSSAGGY